VIVAYVYSSAVIFGLPGKVFFWELATLIDIMLLGHWIEMRSVMGASRALEELVKLIPSEAHRLTEGGDWFYCPYCGRPTGSRGNGMGGPHMMGPDYGYGRGPMHRGWGRGPGMRGWQGYQQPYGPPSQEQQTEPLKEKEAKQIVQDYIASSRNPNLKVGDITDKDNAFEANILTRDGSLVDKILVDKYSGWMRSIY